MAGNAGLSQQSEAVQRKFEVLYLDERVRVVRFLPDADSDSQPQLFVFEREVEDAEDDVEVRLLLDMISSTKRSCIPESAEKSVISVLSDACKLHNGKMFRIFTLLHSYKCGCKDVMLFRHLMECLARLPVSDFALLRSTDDTIVEPE